MIISIYYSEYEDKLAPMQFVIWFGKGNIDWDSKKILIPIKGPFERILPDEFNDDVLSLSITKSDLLYNINQPGEFGIYIPTVQARINKMHGDKHTMKFDQNDIEQFIIQMWDLEEFLKMDISGTYDWR
ncbi:MAG: hypothetical protein WD469_12175 [Paenibacillaceae bacterium]